MTSSITRLRDGLVVASPAHIANSFGSRFRGLLGRTGLDSQEGLLIMACRDVHTCGMRFSIDVIFLNDALEIVRLTPKTRPWRFYRGGRQSRHVLEVASGTIDRLELASGDKFELNRSIEERHCR